MSVSSKSSNKDLSLNQNEDAMKLKLSSLQRKLDTILLHTSSQTWKNYVIRVLLTNSYTCMPNWPINILDSFYSINIIV